MIDNELPNTKKIYSALQEAVQSYKRKSPTFFFSSVGKNRIKSIENWLNEHSGDDDCELEMFALINSVLKSSSCRLKHEVLTALFPNLYDRKIDGILVDAVWLEKNESITCVPVYYNEAEGRKVYRQCIDKCARLWFSQYCESLNKVKKSLFLSFMDGFNAQFKQGKAFESVEMTKLSSVSDG